MLLCKFDWMSGTDESRKFAVENRIDKTCSAEKSISILLHIDSKTHESIIFDTPVAVHYSKVNF